jgi:hypothetical protein
LRRFLQLPQKSKAPLVRRGSSHATVCTLTFNHHDHGKQQ